MGLWRFRWTALLKRDPESMRRILEEAIVAGGGRMVPVSDHLDVSYVTLYKMLKRLDMLPLMAAERARVRGRFRLPPLESESAA